MTVRVYILGGFRMAAVKTASVNVRIDNQVKIQAEAILSQMGIPRAVAIDMFYRQIIMHSGLPFSLTIPRAEAKELPTRDAMSDEAFDQMMMTGLQQARADESLDAEDFFDKLESGLRVPPVRGRG